MKKVFPSFGISIRVTPPIRKFMWRAKHYKHWKAAMERADELYKKLNWQ